MSNAKPQIISIKSKVVAATMQQDFLSGKYSIKQLSKMYNIHRMQVQQALTAQFARQQIASQVGRYNLENDIKNL